MESGVLSCEAKSTRHASSVANQFSVYPCRARRFPSAQGPASHQLVSSNSVLSAVDSRKVTFRQSNEDGADKEQVFSGKVIKDIVVSPHAGEVSVEGTEASCKRFSDLTIKEQFLDDCSNSAAAMFLSQGQSVMENQSLLGVLPLSAQNLHFNEEAYAQRILSRGVLTGLRRGSSNNLSINCESYSEYKMAPSVCEELCNVISVGEKGKEQRTPGKSVLQELAFGCNVEDSTCSVFLDVEKKNISRAQSLPRSPSPEIQSCSVVSAVEVAGSFSVDKVALQHDTLPQQGDDFADCRHMDRTKLYYVLQIPQTSYVLSQMNFSFF